MKSYRKYKLVLVIVILLLVTTSCHVLFSDKENDGQSEYTSKEEMFNTRYTQDNYNYNYAYKDDYYFVSVTKNSITNQTYLHELIYMKETNGELKFEILEDGLNFDIHRRYTGIDLSITEEGVYTSYATCFMYEHNDFYIMYVADLREHIVSIEDNYAEFQLIESVDYGLKYYFNVVPKSDVKEDYIVKFNINDIGIMSFDANELIEVFAKQDN